MANYAIAGSTSPHSSGSNPRNDGYFAILNLYHDFAYPPGTPRSTTQRRVTNPPNCDYELLTETLYHSGCTGTVRDCQILLSYTILSQPVLDPILSDPPALPARSTALDHLLCLGWV